MGYLTEINQLQLKLHIIHKTSSLDPTSQTMQINLTLDQPYSEARFLLKFLKSMKMPIKVQIPIRYLKDLDTNDLYRDKWG